MNTHIVPGKIFVPFKTTDTMQTFPSSHLDEDELAEDRKGGFVAGNGRFCDRRDDRFDDGFSLDLGKAMLRGSLVGNFIPLVRFDGVERDRG